MSGTKQIRMGKVSKFYIAVLALTVNTRASLDASSIPTKKAYYQGKYDALEEIIKAMGREFQLNAQGKFEKVEGEAGDDGEEM